MQSMGIGEVDGLDIGGQRGQPFVLVHNLCKQERKRLTPVRRRLSQTHTVLGRVIPGG